MQLHFADHVVLGVYLAAMMFLGWRLARGQQTEEEYFLGGRRLPWFAVGVSIIASLLSSITYLASPGIVWRFGFGGFVSSLFAIPLDMILILLLAIPFFVRFKFTTAYEYLEHRYDLSVRLLGATMFLLFVTVLMGVIVLVSSRALAVATGLPLVVIIGVIGVVATVYTMMGGIRAVVWTDVIQAALLVGGGLFTVGYVAWVTGSGPLDWFHVVNARDNESFAFFSPDPTVAATVVTMTLSGVIWTLTAHCANQMTLQRYFSTVDVRAAKRSFVTSIVVSAMIALLLAVIGASLVYYYTHGPEALPEHINLASGKDRDSIFPFFVASRIPPGLAGAIFAALLAAAMSTIDSGVNSWATVATVDFGRLRKKPSSGNRVFQARIITLIVGLVVTVSAVYLDGITGMDDILTILPKTFNSLVGSMGALFLAGMLFPRVGTRAVWPAAFIGLAVALGVAYSRDLLQLMDPSTHQAMAGVFGADFTQRLVEKGMGFTWIILSSAVAALGSAWLLSFVFPNKDLDRIKGLTWATRHEPSPFTRKKLV
jgi:SSS family solute:Na+ symporter